MIPITVVPPIEDREVVDEDVYVAEGPKYSSELGPGPAVLRGVSEMAFSESLRSRTCWRRRAAASEGGARGPPRGVVAGSGRGGVPGMATPGGVEGMGRMVGMGLMLRCLEGEGGWARGLDMVGVL